MVVLVCDLMGLGPLRTLANSSHMRHCRHPPRLVSASRLVTPPHGAAVSREVAPCEAFLTSSHDGLGLGFVNVHVVISILIPNQNEPE